MKTNRKNFVAVFACVLLTITTSEARDPIKTQSLLISQNLFDDRPVYCWAQHNIGNILLTVDDAGGFGSSLSRQPECAANDVLLLRGCEFPRGTRKTYIAQGGLLFGGIIGDDTLVSQGVFMAGEFPELFSTRIDERIVHRSIVDSSLGRYAEAISEQDFVTWYADTTELSGPNYRDFLDHRFHAPLGLIVEQRSYAWSYSYADEIVLFDLSVRNPGSQGIKDAYIGLYVDSDVKYSLDSASLATDDLTGFLDIYPDASPCNYDDTLNVAWTADNDGDPLGGEWMDVPSYDPVSQSYKASVRGIVGACVLRAPITGLQPAFNWWQVDGGWDPQSYGPMRIDRYRNFGTGYNGIPSGDRNRYYLMSNGEVDFDQAVIAQQKTLLSRDWIMPRPGEENVIASGSDSRFMLSYGPFDITPGGTLPFSFAILAADQFHRNPENGANLPYDAQQWYSGVDFSNLARNAMWARKIYDNPGYDTDADGYAGEYRVCLVDSSLIDGEWAFVYDTTWYRGDGVPDWRAAGPPPAPDLWLTPVQNGIKVRFNGSISENAKDVLTRKVDFEGYRVYIARDERAASYSLLASYDKENYDKWVFDRETEQWILRDDPLSPQQLRCLYGSGPDPCADSSFDPLAYTRRSPLLAGDSVFYFTAHDRNVSNLGSSSLIHKRFPDVPDPRTIHPDSITEDMYTDDGYLKFYEYEFEVNQLLPTVPYWVNVTAFDHGSPESGLQPLESSVTLGAAVIYPFHERDAAVSGSDEVYVYPNPYRIDAGYRALGFEGRTQQDRMDDKVRAINFANLPPRCTINIFTLDGDRVDTIEHDKDPGAPDASHHRWDLINRNFQKVVSGLYYWTVETPQGEVQVGKIVILR